MKDANNKNHSKDVRNFLQHACRRRFRFGSVVARGKTRLEGNPLLRCKCRVVFVQCPWTTTAFDCGLAQRTASCV